MTLRRSALVLALSLVLSLSTTLFTRAYAANPESVVLDSLTATDTFAKAQILKIQKAGATEVELYHVGNETPVELQALARWFQAASIQVHYKKVTAAELETVVTEQADRLAPTVPAIASLIGYEAKVKTKTPLRTEIVSRIKHFFGVPGGISFMTYAQKRSLKEKAVEGGFALAKAAVTSTVMYFALASKAAHGEHVNIVLPIIASAVFSLGFDYWQRGNSAFKGQGVNYDFETQKASMNRKFYLLTALVHSVIVREIVMASSHITDIGFTMGWVGAWLALQNSFKGLLGKAPIEMFIERGRRTHGKWWTIGWMSAWGTIYASLQILDLFEAGPAFRTALTALGTAGLGFELYKERSYLYNGFMRAIRRITGQQIVEKCETLLVVK